MDARVVTLRIVDGARYRAMPEWPATLGPGYRPSGGRDGVSYERSSIADPLTRAHFGGARAAGYGSEQGTGGVMLRNRRFRLVLREFGRSGGYSGTSDCYESSADFGAETILRSRAEKPFSAST